MLQKKKAKYDSLFKSLTPSKVDHFIIIKIYWVSLRTYFLLVTNTHRSYTQANACTKTHYIILLILFCDLLFS